MKPVLIYTQDHCPYCVHAQMLLESKKIPYEKRKREEHADAISGIMEQYSYFSFPMIFIGEKFIGGFSDLKALSDSKELDSLLSDAQS